MSLRVPGLGRSPSEEFGTPLSRPSSSTEYASSGSSGGSPSSSPETAQRVSRSTKGLGSGLRPEREATTRSGRKTEQIGLVDDRILTKEKKEKREKRLSNGEKVVQKASHLFSRAISPRRSRDDTDKLPPPEARTNPPSPTLISKTASATAPTLILPTPSAELHQLHQIARFKNRKLELFSLRVNKKGEYEWWTGTFALKEIEKVLDSVFKCLEQELEKKRYRLPPPEDDSIGDIGQWILDNPNMSLGLKNPKLRNRWCKILLDAKCKQPHEAISTTLESIQRYETAIKILNFCITHYQEQTISNIKEEFSKQNPQNLVHKTLRYNSLAENETLIQRLHLDRLYKETDDYEATVKTIRDLIFFTPKMVMSSSEFKAWPIDEFFEKKISQYYGVSNTIEALYEQGAQKGYLEYFLSTKRDVNTLTSIPRWRGVARDALPSMSDEMRLRALNAFQAGNYADALTLALTGINQIMLLMDESFINLLSELCHRGALLAYTLNPNYKLVIPKSCKDMNVLTKTMEDLSKELSPYFVTVLTNLVKLVKSQIDLKPGRCSAEELVEYSKQVSELEQKLIKSSPRDQINIYYALKRLVVQTFKTG